MDTIDIIMALECGELIIDNYEKWEINKDVILLLNLHILFKVHTLP